MVRFHLAYPVKSLSATRRFFEETFACQVGRVRETWLDLYFFGHQLTFHQKPEEVPSLDQRGVSHMGAVLPWERWLAFGSWLKEKGIAPLRGPELKQLDGDNQQGKIFFRDPNGYLIEIKAYRDERLALNLPAKADELPF